jgi:DnaD/phage-associated family protein
MTPNPSFNPSINPSVVVDGNGQRPNIFKIYEQEIGAITPMLAEELKDVEKDFPDGWFKKAVKEAKLSTTRISLKYVVKILDRWKAEGLPNEYQDETTPHEKRKVQIQHTDGTIKEMEV